MTGQPLGCQRGCWRRSRECPCHKTHQYLSGRDYLWGYTAPRPSVCLSNCVTLSLEKSVRLECDVGGDESQKEPRELRSSWDEHVVLPSCCLALCRGAGMNMWFYFLLSGSLQRSWDEHHEVQQYVICSGCVLPCPGISQIMDKEHDQKALPPPVLT